MREGFQLDPSEIAARVHKDLVMPGWHLALYPDAYARVADSGMSFTVDSVDRAVVVFVGSRDEAERVATAARETLRP